MLSSKRIHFIIYLILLALHIGLVWWLPYFPTQDGPSHLYNLVILHDLLNGGKEWGQFFTYQLHLVPNLAFEAISYPLLKILPPLAIEKIFVSLYIALLGTSVPCFLRTFGRPPLPLAFLVFPVIFNFTLMMGFYSYVITIPIFLFGVSLSWKERNAPAAKKFIIFNLAGVIIFFSHLIPFIFFIIFLFAMRLAEFAGFRRFLAQTAKLTAILTPSLVCFLLYLLAGRENGSPSHVARATLDYLFTDLCFFSTVTFSPKQMVPAYLLLGLVIIGAYSSFKHIKAGSWRLGNNTPGKTTMLIFLVLLLFIYFFMPFRFGGGSYFNDRFPWVILLSGLPLLFLNETEATRKFISSAGVVVALLFFGVNAAVFSDQCELVREYLGGLRMALPRGVLVMTYKTKDAGWSRADVLVHAASYYGMCKGVVDTGNYEAGLPYFPVQFRKTVTAIPPQKQIEFAPTKIEWSLYPSIRYLFAWDLEAVERKKLGADFHIIREEGRLTIWERNNREMPIPGNVIQYNRY